jgi:ribosomal protein L16/L10AE
MRVLKLIAPVVLAIIAQEFSADIGSTQAPELECRQLANAPDNGAPQAIRLEALTSAKIESSQIEAACRSALSRLLKNSIYLVILV